MSATNEKLEVGSDVLVSRRFPIQAKDLDGPIRIPWEHAEEAYKEYVARFGSQQSLERLAERQGFGAGEIVMLLVGRIKRLESQAANASDQAAASEKH